MPLDEATRRFAFLLQRDLRRLAERREEAAARGEEIRYDSGTRIVELGSRRGEPVARLYGEVLATYAPYDRILRWAWAGRSSSAAPTHGDVVFREGQARGVPQLTMSVVGDLDRDDAKTLAELGALVARAEGLHERVSGSEIELIGIFDRARPSDASAEPARDSRFSVPPPPPVERNEPKGPPARAYRSVPPIREIFEPRTASSRPRSMGPGARTSSPPPAAAVGKLREPSRALFLPVANAALSALTRGSKGYLQGLFVVTIETRDAREPGSSGTRGIVVVQLVAIDAAGILRALDPPSDVVDAAVAMVDADRREGNAWRRLAARITPKPDGGATLHVDVT